MRNWRTGTLGYWDRMPNGNHVFEPNLNGAVQMVEVMDDTGNEATVVQEVDEEGFTVLVWRVQID